MTAEDRPTAGVVGVGTMGRHHARVYNELPGAALGGVTDADGDRAAEVARQYGVEAMDLSSLLSTVDLVSVAVPTEYHHEMAAAAIDRGVATLVEKPFVREPRKGWDLVERARDAGVVLAAGHVERFNPGVAMLEDVVRDLDLVGIQARRLGPPVDGDRAVEDGVGLDLMVHDIDVVRSVVDRSGGDPDDVRVVGAAGAAGGKYVTALMEFDGLVCEFTASRLTQRKVRDLLVTARECCVSLDYTERTIRIHRRSTPSYVADDGELQFRNESVTERRSVEDGEPLARELGAFVRAVRADATPPVTGVDGVRAVELARAVEHGARRVRMGVAK